ncbi:hypothetical protein [Plebeiibacterium sediminum]|uniref:Uncharacterized protein n=1 Tax=Plebeiibacterium sediminum TaxID=2992112 RepID=A0AAE3SDN4_9BACT|nr:hypothetical protein [Plebeiobacterium sediminum]MCW3785430.1 hypothetical protein [Plebeiobacterium sediminum]
MKTELEELTFLKESWLEEKKFMVFQNHKGELRAVEAHIVQVPNLTMGDKLKARVRKKGCSGREIETVYL